MKKNKKCENVNPNAAVTNLNTVGNLIGALHVLPEDAFVDIRENGINISHDSFGGKVLAISNKKDYFDEADPEYGCTEVLETVNGSELDDTLIEKITRNGYDHLYGCININPEARKVAGTIDNYRDTSSDDLIVKDICCPSPRELEWEANHFNEHDIDLIDEIRFHNLEMVESMTELYRRQLTAMSEYNLQVALRVSDMTRNRVMCDIVGIVDPDEVKTF